MDEQQLRNDLIAISSWADPVVVPDTEDLDALDVRTHPGDSGTNAGTGSGSPWRRALLAAAAVLLVVGGVWVLTGRDDPESVAPTPTTTPTTPTSGPTSGSGWVETPPAPLLTRAEAQALWTGKEFVVFAGTDQAPCPVCDYFSYGETRRDAAAYDPATNTWRTIADLPEASSYVGSSAMLGGDVFWLSVRDPSTNESGVDATLQRWSSADDTWTEIPLPAEVPPGPRLAAVGEGLVLYPGTDEVGTFPDQLWSDGTWTALPDDPLGLSYDRQIVDGGDALVLFAKSLADAQNTAQPSVVQGATLFSGVWEAIPDSDQLYAPMTRLGDSMYAPFGGGADGGEVGNWGRTVPNGGSYSLDTQTWSAFPPTAPDDLMGIVSNDGTAVFGVKGSILDVDAGAYSTIPTLPDGIGDQFGQAVANGGGTVFTFGGGYSDATSGGLGVHGRAFVWRPSDSGATPTDTTPAETTSPPDTAAPTAGDVATWELADGAPTSAGTTFSVRVTRLACAGGVTGTVLRPVVQTSDTEIVVWFSVEPLPDPEATYTCQGNDAVPATVTLAEPIGNRRLVDGACRDTSAATTSFCESDQGIRWTPAAPADSPTIEAATFCDAAVALLESPDLFAVRELIADLRAVDTSALSAQQRGTYLAGITALEDRVGSPDGYDTTAVTDAVNELCGTELSQFFATP